MLHDFTGFNRRVLVLFHSHCPGTATFFEVYVERHPLSFFVSTYGLTSSPRIFTKALKPVFAHYRGHCLGDLVCMLLTNRYILRSDTYESSLRNTFTAVQLFISLGFQVHPKKSMVMRNAKKKNTWDLYCRLWT